RARRRTSAPARPIGPSPLLLQRTSWPPLSDGRLVERERRLCGRRLRTRQSPGSSWRHPATRTERNYCRRDPPRHLREPVPLGGRGGRSAAPYGPISRKRWTTVRRSAILECGAVTRPATTPSTIVHFPISPILYGGDALWRRSSPERNAGREPRAAAGVGDVALVPMTEGSTRSYLT